MTEPSDPVVGASLDIGEDATVRDVVQIGQMNAGTVNLRSATERARPKVILAPPGPGEWFVGRADEIRSLSDELWGDLDARPFAVVGMGGVGKSALVASYCSAMADRYEHVLWVRAQDPATIPSQYAVAARQILGEDVDPELAVEIVRSQLSSSGPWLLVFDDLSDRTGLADLLPSAGGHVIVTSRDPTIVSNPRRCLRLRPLSEPVARQWMDGATDGSDDAVAKLSAALGGLPLAVTQVVATCRSMHLTTDQYHERFEAELLEMMGTGEPLDHPSSLLAVWRISTRAAEAHDANAYVILVFLSLLAEEVHWPWLVDDDTEPMRRGLVALERVGLITWLGDAVSTHPLIQEITLQVTPNDAVGRVSSRLGLRLMTSAPSPEDPAGFDVWAALLPHVFSLTEKARARGGIDGPLLGLASFAAAYLRESGQPRAAIAVLDRALSRLRPQMVPPPVLGHAYLVHGSAQRDVGAFAEAEDLARAAIELLMPEAKPAALNDLGQTIAFQGRYHEAIEVYRQALQRLDDLGPEALRGLRGAIAHNLGNALHGVGDDEAAIEHLFTDLAISEELAGRKSLSVARTLQVLATVMAHLGRADEAVEIATEAVATTAAIVGVDHPDHANTLMSLSNVQSRLGRRADAMVNQYEVVRILRQLNDGQPHFNLATALSNLAQSLRVAGDLDRSLEIGREGLDMAQRVFGEDSSECALGHSMVGLTLLGMDRLDEAIEALSAAVAGYDASGSEVRAAQMRLPLAACLDAVGQTIDRQRTAAALELLTERGLVEPGAQREIQAILARVSGT